MAKRNKIKGIPIFREDQGNCMNWCHKNGIRMHIKLGDDYSDSDYRKKTVWKIKPYEKGLVKIEIYNNGVITTSPKLYTQEEANMKIWELYCHFYDTNN